MNISIVGRNPVNAYSGGRYHAWGLAEAIAQNHNIIYFTNAKPMFADDFKDYEKHNKIDLRVIDDKFYDIQCEKEIDIIFFIPGMDKDNTFYKNTIKFAHDKKAHLVFINFESPNWFNKYSVIQRDYKLWDNWLMMSKFSSCILSISQEGISYAENFYKNLPKDSFFDYCYPTINSKIADMVYDDNSIKKENRIIMTARFSLSEHKGSYNIPQLFCEEMRGYTFVLILGSGDVPKNIKKEIEKKANEYGVTMEYKHTLNDFQKFVEIKRAKVLLFPSFFEGFGYPPIEAQYMNTACVAFRIPVVEETSPNIDFVKLGDWIGFKETIAKVLQREPKKYRENIIAIASFDSMIKKIDDVITKVSKLSLPSELNDISSIKISLQNSLKNDEFTKGKEAKIKILSSLKGKMKKVVGDENYVKMKCDYLNYKNGKIGFWDLNVRFFSSMVLKKIISDKSYNKLKNIYYTIKG